MKPTRSTLALAATAALWLGPMSGACSPSRSSAPPAVPPPTVAPPTVAPSSAASFVGDFEQGDLSAWDGREAAREDSIEVVRAPVRRGRWAAKFTVRPGDKVSNGARAEIIRDNLDRAGSQVWCSWSFFIPSDYADAEWKPRGWQCLGQWHDQPDRERGETWDNFPGHSPSIALYYSFRKGVPAIEMWYGARQEQDIVATVPIAKGRWNDVLFHIFWSTRADGFAQAWLNGQPLAPGEDHTVRGANMWNHAPHYLKIGLYRDPEVATINSVYFDEVRIGHSRQQVLAQDGARP